MNYTLVVVFSFSISIAAIIGWIRFRKINLTYYPFLFCIWIAFLNEILSFFIVQRGFSTAINDNIYILTESLLITWQFKNWGLFRRAAYLFVLVICAFLVFWVSECFFINGINLTISYFTIFYSFVIVLMSVNIINQELARESKNILKNPIFLLSVAFVIYYTINVIVGIFWLYGLQYNNQFAMNITAILLYINLLTNLIYALAVLWMPIKHRFSLPS